MNLLAIDTSSVACSVALQAGIATFERHEEQAREHTRLLLPMVRDVLDAAGTTVAGLDAVVLGNGPGSFIGMRIAAAVAQGLAHGGGIGIVPVSSLAAVAAEVFATSGADEVIVAQDAHMQEVYLGIFGRGGDGIPALLAEERLQSQTAIDEIEDGNAKARVAAGFGWDRYPALFAANRPFLTGRSTVLHPRARFLLPLGSIGLERGEALDPKDINPAYLRQKVAEKPRGAGP